MAGFSPLATLKTGFSVQSISKVFTLTLALEKAADDVWNRVSREPSGTPFNSIVQLERENGIPRNPFINAGAIVIADIILAGRAPSAAISEITGFIKGLSQDPSIAIDPEVARSEAESGFRNASLANFMKGFGNIESPVEHCLETYFHHCALSMNCIQLARAGLFLANGGRDPRTAKQIISAERARRINALMLTCGHYDASGDFAFRVGLPGKSGRGRRNTGHCAKTGQHRRVVAGPERQRQFAGGILCAGKAFTGYRLVNFLIAL